MKTSKKKSDLSRNISALCRFFHIPDNSNIIERQHAFVFLFSSFGFLVGILPNILLLFGLRNQFFVSLNTIHSTLILLVIALYVQC